jgi:AcrR family transcriptional regulator
MSLAASRGERRKQETRERVLAAAERVFLRLGFDAATTGEISAEADVGAGTFYLHFRDKRDVFETLCRHAAREVIDRWRERLPAEPPLAESVALALEAAAEYWSENRARARLLLDGGPTFGSEAHVRLLEHFAGLIAGDVRSSRPTSLAAPSPEVAATVVVGLAIELGRVIVGMRPTVARRTVAGTIALARRTLDCSLATSSSTAKAGVAGDRPRLARLR